MDSNQSFLFSHDTCVTRIPKSKEYAEMSETGFSIETVASLNSPGGGGECGGGEGGGGEGGGGEGGGGEGGVIQSTYTELV